MMMVVMALVWLFTIKYVQALAIQPSFWGQLRALRGIEAPNRPLSLGDYLIMLLMNFAGAWTVSELGELVRSHNIPIVSSIFGLIGSLSFFYFGIPMVFILMLTVVTYVTNKLS